MHIGTIYGDSNLDSFRDLVDLNDWLANTDHVGTAAWVKGDWDGDGFVNLVDLNAWLAETIAGGDGPAAVIPEPASLALLMAGGSLLLIRRRGRPSLLSPAPRDWRRLFVRRSKRVGGISSSRHANQYERSPPGR